jgi:hypothetical protein
VEKLERLSVTAVECLEGWPLFNNAIVQYGFTPYLRDYELQVVATAAVPGEARSYQEGRYRFLFTHCVLARVETAVGEEGWRSSWDDLFTDYAAWERAGCPSGYVFGVNEMEAYPGATYIADSLLAAEWTRRLDRRMHEVKIESNGHRLQLVFHSLRVHKIAQGDPATGRLSPVVPVDLLAPPAT